MNSEPPKTMSNSATDRNQPGELRATASFEYGRRS
jgi:hypothetical protein